MPVPTSNLLPFRWDPRTGQYVNGAGKFVSRAKVRSVIDDILKQESANARDLALGLRNGDISLEAWRLSMRELIKNVHLLDAAAAKGGWAQLGADDYGRIGAIVKKEYQYLERLSRGISSGKIPLDGRIVQRAQLYAQAGRDTYHQVERATMAKAGYRFEANVLHPADHCGGCLGETARGRVRIGQLIPVGRRDCLRNCRCSMAYFKTGPSA
jgi:hypothetical protein